LLHEMPRRRGIPHQVLNAKFHEKGAEIVDQAGRLGAVTIATNMGGSGTASPRGGTPDYLAKEKLRAEGFSPEVIAEATGRYSLVKRLGGGGQANGAAGSAGVSPLAEAGPPEEEVARAYELYQKYYAEFKKQTDAEREKVL